MSAIINPIAGRREIRKQVFPAATVPPTKSRILEIHQDGSDYYYDLAFGKRPLDELFDTYEYVGASEASHSWKALQEGWREPQKY